MITVNGTPTDYAIMKQVQQARKAHPASQVVPLAAGTRFSTLAADEPLFIVSHGDRATGNLRNINTADLISWLTHGNLGVPARFGGVVILSCYSGLSGPIGVPVSLAGQAAQGLTNHTAAGTPVSGTNGYSFGTPEFSRTYRSSVLSLDLDDFYWAEDIPAMKAAWIAHRPTHSAGVLKDVFNCKTVDVDKTAGQNIRKAIAIGGSAADKKLDEGVTTLVTEFAKKAKGIENQLKAIIGRIPGTTVAEKSDYFVANSTERDVVDWNKAIDNQYQLFQNHYLWTPPKTSFTTEKTS